MGRTSPPSRETAMASAADSESCPGLNTLLTTCSEWDAGLIRVLGSRLSTADHVVLGLMPGGAVMWAVLPHPWSQSRRSLSLMRLGSQAEGRPRLVGPGPARRVRRPESFRNNSAELVLLPLRRGSGLFRLSVPRTAAMKAEPPPPTPGSGVPSYGLFRCPRRCALLLVRTFQVHLPGRARPSMHQTHHAPH